MKIESSTKSNQYSAKKPKSSTALANLSINEGRASTKLERPQTFSICALLIFLHSLLLLFSFDPQLFSFVGWYE